MNPKHYAVSLNHQAVKRASERASEGSCHLSEGASEYMHTYLWVRAWGLRLKVYGLMV